MIKIPSFHDNIMSFFTWLDQLLCPHIGNQAAGIYNKSQPKVIQGHICTSCGKRLNKNKFNTDQDGYIKLKSKDQSK